MVALAVPHISQPVAEIKDGKLIVNADWHRFFDQLQTVAAAFDDTGLSGSGIASVANVRSAATGDKVIVTALLESASAAVALTETAGAVAVDWDTFIYGTVTVDQATVISNPTNGQPGTWRTILVQGNDATDRTITFGNQFGGEVPTITDCDSTKRYLLMLFCKTSTQFLASAIDGSDA